MTPLPPSQGVPRERTQAQHGGRAGAGGCSPSSSRINGVDPCSLYSAWKLSRANRRSVAGRNHLLPTQSISWRPPPTQLHVESTLHNDLFAILISTFHLD